MKKFIGKAIKKITKPMVVAGEFMADRNLPKVGVLWGVGVAITLAIPALLGAFSVTAGMASLIAGVGAGPFLLSSAVLFAGVLAEKAYDFGSDLHEKAIREEYNKDNEFANKIKKELKEDNEEYAEYSGMTKKQIKLKLQADRKKEQDKYSVDELGY